MSVNLDTTQIIATFLTVYLLSAVSCQQLNPQNVVVGVGSQTQPGSGGWPQPGTNNNMTWANNGTSWNNGSTNNNPATFTCSGAQSGEVVTLYIYNPGQNKLYVSQVGYLKQEYANKYQVSQSNGNGDLSVTILNPTLSDGVAVGCDFTSSPSPVYANLMVIEKPTSTVLLKSTMQPPSSGQTLNAGTEVWIQCMVNFAAPTKDGGFSSIANPTPPTPQLMMQLGGQTVQNPNCTYKVALPNMAGDTHSITCTYDYVISAQDSGKSVTCTVSTSNPQYSDMSSTSLNTASQTKNIRFFKSTNGTFYRNYDYINCSADGYPTPYVSWTPVSPNDLNTQDGTSYQGYAVLRPSRKGPQQWNCTARQTQSGMQGNASIAFMPLNIDVEDYNSTEVKKKSADVGLGVGLGVGIGVPVLIGIIILVAILMKRKKSRSPPAYSVTAAEKKSSPKKNNAAEKPKNGPGGEKQKNNEPGRIKRPDPTPPKNGTAPPPGMVNNNPMPYNTTAHGTNPGRDSPGFGDLGVRQMNGSGSNPQLNQSYDNRSNTSFDRQLQAPPTAHYANRSFTHDDPNTQV